MAILETYKVTADSVPATISIVSVSLQLVPQYEIIMPELDKGTEALLNHLSEELSPKIPLMGSMQKETFLKEAMEALTRRLPGQKESEIKILAGMLLHRMLGLGFLEILMKDNWLEEISINGSKQPISVYHKKYGWCKTTKTFGSEEEIYNIASQIGRKAGREINSLQPIMDAHLETGDRVAATLFPVSQENTITIRRFARNPWTPVHFIEAKTLSPEIASLLWQAMQYELNILIAGGTASGKTSMLNSICSFLPASQRIISIEDTREIRLPNELVWNWIPLSSRNRNPEGMGEVTMLDLMVASLRMRPDRIIVGEIRRKRQAESLFEAMHTGHSVYATMHADTAEQVRRRLTEPPMAIPSAELEALHLVVVQYRDRRKGVRRVLEVAEVLGNEGKIELNHLYRWRARGDSFEKVNESISIQEELNLHTGMTPKEIEEDRRQKQVILQWMAANNVKEIDDVGRLMRIYYKDPLSIYQAAEKKKKIKDIL